MKKLIFLPLLLLFSACMGDKNLEQNSIVEEFNSSSKTLFNISPHEGERYADYEKNPYLALKALENVKIQNITANNGQCILLMHLTPWESENSYFLHKISSNLEKELEALSEGLEESSIIAFKGRTINLKSGEEVNIEVDEGCRDIANLSIFTNKGNQILN